MGKVDRSRYYDKGQLLSRGALLNFIIGHRGVGKSYDFKKWCVRDFIQKGKQFVWLRRYGSELDTIMNWPADIAHEFPKNEITIKKAKNMSRVYVDGELAGFVFALTKSGQVKSTSYVDVDKICFDEFLIMPGSKIYYLRNDVEALLDIMETVFRERDAEDGIRGVFCIANNISFDNPYFREFNIQPFQGRFKEIRERSICVEKYENRAFIERKKKTRFGKLTAGTKYGAYAIENESFSDNEVFIEKLSKDADFIMTIRYNSNDFGVWYDDERALVWCSRYYNPNASPIVFSKTDHEPDLKICKASASEPVFESLLNAFKIGHIRFDTLYIKNDVFELMKTGFKI